MTNTISFEKNSLWSRLLYLVQNKNSVDQQENTVVYFDKENRENKNIIASRLLEEYGNSMLRMAYSYLHNISDAEDIVQDTLIQYLRYAPVLDTPHHEKAWLMRVASNLSKNKIKYIKKRDTLELDEKTGGKEQQDLAFVWEAVGGLPVKYREVIHLFYHEDNTTAEIALLLNKKESTVRSLLSRGRAILKKQLKEVYDFAE